MNQSMESENSSKGNENKRGKTESLYKAFNDLNWDTQKNLSSEDILYFLNTNSKSGKFDQDLYEQLLKHIGLEGSNSISVQDFISAFLQFDSDIQRTKDKLSDKLLVQKNSLFNYEEQCKLYKHEKLNSEGLCENAKLTIEVNSIEIKTDLGDINIEKILIDIIYNNETKENIFSVNEDNDGKIFEFKPISKTENFTIVLKCESDKNDIIEIGRKEFPMNEITTQEEIPVLFEIPAIDNEDNVGAELNLKILFFWSNYQYNMEQKDKTELKIEEITKNINQVNKYCNEIKDIFSKNINIEEQNLNINEIQWNDSGNKPNIKGNNNYVDIDNNDDNIGKNDNLLLTQSHQDSLTTENINPKMLFYIRLIGFILLGLGLLDGFYRNDFPNQLCGVLILANFFKFFAPPENFKFFKKLNFYFCLIVLIYDILWIFLRFGEDDEIIYAGGSCSCFGTFTKFIVILSAAIKIPCLFILFKIKG